jgi:MFS family permease
MSTAPAPTPEKFNFAGSLDFLGRSTATMLLIMYGSGFVILAAYEARFGVVQFGPLRARIFLVGFAFTILSALPIAAHHYGFAYFGQLKKVIENKEPSLRSERAAVLGFGFSFTAYLMALTFSFFLFEPRVVKPGHHGWPWFVALPGVWIVFLVIYMWIGLKFTQHPKKSVILAIAGAVIFLGTLLWVSPEKVSGLTLWFWVAAMAGKAVRDNNNLVMYALDYRTWSAIFLSMSIYITMVVGHIHQKFGGGAPVSAVMYVNKPVPLSNGTTMFEVSLLDETDQGYYVLPPGKQKALFIPRSEVSAIYFGTVADLPKTP